VPEWAAHGNRYPEIEPYETGVLEAGHGHRVYWEVCGNPNGKPAIFLHGGPGSGCSAGQRRFFDPDAYRVVLFDQRGAGRSRPLASDSAADLRTNTTPHLIADIELLRRHHRVESWTMLGMSWGTTLGLAYAEAHPQRVNALVLAAVTTTSRREVQWVTHDAGRIFPQAWDRFVSAVPQTMRHLPLVDAYAALVLDSDPSVHDRAARDWCTWEDAHVSLTPGHTPNPHFEDP
jgi:proline iminopeptidase